MKKHTKILLLLSSALIALGLILMVVGGVMGAHFDRIYHEGLWDVVFYRSQASTGDFRADGSYTLSPDGVHGLSVDWLDGAVTIEAYDGADISIQEICAQPLDEHNALDYRVSGGTLEIFCIRSPKVGFTFSYPSLQKDLVIRIPRQLAQRLSDLEVSSVDSGVVLKELHIGDAELSMADGDVTIQGGAVSELSLGSMKGALNLQGTQAGTINMDTMDGSLVGSFPQCPQSIEFDSMSGSMELRLPRDSQFVVDWDGLEKTDFHSDFPGVRHDGLYIVGDGSAQFSMDTLSGSLSLRFAD